MIKITDDIFLDDKEIREDFIRSSGPGGQNVNKVSTAVKLRFDVVNSPSLPQKIRMRLIETGGARINRKGVLVIDARRHRTREANRKEAVKRLVDLIKEAAKEPKKRKKTKPSPRVKEKRLAEKHQRSKIKRFRKPVLGDDE